MNDPVKAISSEKSITPKFSILMVLIGIFVFALIILALASLEQANRQAAAESSIRSYNSAKLVGNKESICFNAKSILSEEHAAGNDRAEAKWKKIVFDNCERTH